MCGNVDNMGNVVIGYTSDTLLMLDCDLKREDEVIEFAREYAKFQGLGSVLVMLTSDSTQVDLLGKPLGNYCIIFGQPVDRLEWSWHIGECLRLGMINKAFAVLRNYGNITIRANKKNKETPYPRIIYYFANGDETGVNAFLEYWEICRNLGGRGDKDDTGKRFDAEERPWRMGDKNLC
jgi:hypothetical protein